MMASRAATTIPRRKGRIGAGHILVIAIVVILGAMFVPTTMVIAVGLLPSAAAFIVDQDAKRSITMTVTLMNSVGVLPFVLELWKKGQTIDHSLALIGEPVTWLIMYGAAGVGWVICFTIPHIVQLILAQRARLQIAELERQQEDLRHEWGEEVKQKPAFPAQPPT